MAAESHNFKPGDIIVVDFYGKEQDHSDDLGYAGYQARIILNDGTDLWPWKCIMIDGPRVSDEIFLDASEMRTKESYYGF